MVVVISESLTLVKKFELKDYEGTVRPSTTVMFQFNQLHLTEEMKVVMYDLRFSSTSPNVYYILDATDLDTSQKITRVKNCVLIV